MKIRLMKRDRETPVSDFYTVFNAFGLEKKEPAV